MTASDVRRTAGCIPAISPHRRVSPRHLAGSAALQNFNASMAWYSMRKRTHKPTGYYGVTNNPVQIHSPALRGDGIDNRPGDDSKRDRCTTECCRRKERSVLLSTRMMPRNHLHNHPELQSSVGLPLPPMRPSLLAKPPEPSKPLRLENRSSVEATSAKVPKHLIANSKVRYSPSSTKMHDFRPS